MGRSLPAEWGLRPAQMLDALEGMGFSAIHYSRDVLDGCSRFLDAVFPVKIPHTKDEEEEYQSSCARRQNAKLADIAYRYVESGLPVILQTDKHAVIAVGHTYQHTLEHTDPHNLKKSGAAIQRIPSFIVHDDEVGPYVEVPLLDCELRRNNRASVTFSDVHTIFAVVPGGVTLRGEEAEAMARNSVEEFLNSGRNRGQSTVRTKLAEIRPELADYLDHLEYRTYLQRDYEWQARVRDEAARGIIGPGFGSELLALDYPKYVWVSEVSSRELLRRRRKHQRYCLGRVVIDSSAPAGTAGTLAVHLADFLHLPDSSGVATAGKDDAPPHFEPGFAPFQHQIFS